MMVFGLMALPWTTIAATQPFQPDTGAEVQTSGLHGSQQMLNVSPVFRGVAMGGKWGLNVTAAQNLPNDYFLLLNRLKVNWVTVQVSLYINDSMDSNIQPRYAGVPFPTYTDQELTALIGAFHNHGIKVMLILALEDVVSRNATHPVQRWQLGNPVAPAGVAPQFWPWDPAHPQHARFVAQFWQSYAGQAARFAQFAQSQGVEMFGLGVETETLFRSRSGPGWPNNFLNEMRAMVTAVRNVYHGLLTYDMEYGGVIDSTVSPPGLFGPGSAHLWEDLNLDVIGISAYFPLASAPPNRVLTVAELETAWEGIFQSNLIPLSNSNPNRPIAFIEYGYVDAVNAPYAPATDESAPREFSDTNGNGMDDGLEQQANIHQALFNTMVRHPGVLDGMFFWGMMMGSDQDWDATYAPLREFSIRAKPAEAVVQAAFTGLAVPRILLGLNGATFNSAANKTMTLSAATVAGSPPVNADIYLALQLPNGALLVMQPDGSFTTVITPVLPNIPVPNFNGSIFSYMFTGLEPAGTYSWFAVLAQPGTFNVIGTMAVASFTFVP